MPEPDEITIELEEITHQTMINEADGRIDIQVSGGTWPYDIEWSNGGNQSLNKNLSPGIYTVEVEDANGCTTNAEYEIEALQCALLLDRIYLADASCWGSEDGVAELFLLDPIGEVTYEWSHDLQITTSHVENLGFGHYSIVATDAAGCQVTEEFFIGEPARLRAVIRTDSSDFEAQNGTAYLTIQGGTEPYQIVWSTGESDTEQLTSLHPDRYWVEITDANGCIDRDYFDIHERSFQCAISSEINIEQPIHCAGGNDGAISLSVAGSHGNLSITWEDNTSAIERSGLSAGQYSVLVEDETGCLSSAQIELTQPPPLEYTSELSNTDPMSGGSIQLEITGGSTPYEILWNTGDTTCCLDSLSDGLYWVRITDAFNCTPLFDTFSISTIPCTISLEAVILDSIACYGENTGSISVAIHDQDEFGTIQWSHDPQLNALLAHSLSAGQYEVSYLAKNGCSDTTTIILTEPDELIVTLTAQHPVLDSMNGSITSSISGGIMLYQIMWSTGETSPTISMLDLGEYSIEVVDQNACSVQESITLFRDTVSTSDTTVISDTTNIDTPDKEVPSCDTIFSITIQQPDCGHPFGQIMIINLQEDTFPSFTIEGSSHEIPNELIPGDYLVRFDTTYCSNTIPFTITEIENPTISCSVVQHIQTNLPNAIVELDVFTANEDSVTCFHSRHA